MGTISRSLRRRRHGFSLIELAVVLIVIAFIAAIAVPAFQTVIERSQDRAAVAGQQAVAREVNALIALEMDPLDALAAALADTSAAAPGVHADGASFGLADEKTPGESVDAEDPSKVAWALDGGYLGWATWISDGKGVKCRVPETGGSSQCWMSASAASGAIAAAGPEADGAEPAEEEEGELDDDGGGPVTIPTTTIAAPSAPAGVSAEAGDESVTITWAEVSGASGYTVFQGTSDDFEAAESVASPVGATATVTGLTNGAQYWFWVVAVGAGGSSSPSDAVTATPAASGPAGNFYLLTGGTSLERSADGASWSTVAHTPISGQGWLASVGSTLLRGSTSAGNQFMVSSDGVAWAGSTQNLNGSAVETGAVHFNGHNYVFGGNSMFMSSSWTGWASAGHNCCSAIRDMAASPTRVVAVTASGIQSKGTTGGWTIASGVSGSWRTVTWTGSRFIAVPDSGTWKTSTDGMTWTNLSGHPGASNTSTIVASNGTVIYAGSGMLRRSTDDGATWTNVAAGITAPSTAPVKVATDGAGTWVAAYASTTTAHRVVISTDDGASWSYVEGMSSRIGAMNGLVWVAD